LRATASKTQRVWDERHRKRESQRVRRSIKKVMGRNM